MAIEYFTNPTQQDTQRNRTSSMPPLLTRPNHSPLPPLLPQGAPDPVLHPTLRAGAAPLSNSWDTRTFPYLGPGSHNYPPWLTHPATYPPLASVVVRVVDVVRTREAERPIVVFPSGERNDVVTVQCLLRAVHCFIAAHGDGGGVTVGGNIAAVWIGLSPSTTESEVWTLNVA